MYEITMLCLANSRKPPSGRCIAGKKFVKGKVYEWMRPISARPTHEVSEEERRYESGKKAQLLDIVTVPLMKAIPSGHQVENHTLDADYYWSSTGRANWKQVTDAVDSYDASFWSESQSTYHGLNDKVAGSDISKIKSSLKLVLVPNVEIRVRSEAGYEGNPSRRRVRASFGIKKKSYLLSVTDPEIEECYLVKGDGDYQLGEAALCISLAEVWNGFAFRVVASVITPERCA
jgi:hypothetical protein